MLDEAWREAEAALLEWADKARFRSVELAVFRDLSDVGEPVRYTVLAERILHREPDGPPAERHWVEVDGETPVEALQKATRQIKERI